VGRQEGNEGNEGNKGVKEGREGERKGGKDLALIIGQRSKSSETDRYN
jgi:hypothetical protein